ncbi:MAG: GumC family protein, partial [Beijerinckiaceae bacterium]
KESAAVAAVSLGNLIADLRKKLAEAEGKVESFRAQSGLQVGANNALLPSQALAEINTQLATARNAMAEAQAKAKLIRETLRQGRLGEVSDVAKDEVVRRLAIQRSTLRSQLALESRTLGPAHPRIKELRAQLSSVESELGNAANKAAHALENDARIASNRVENLQAAISSQQEKVGSTSVDQVKLREYELEAKLIREQLENNLNKYREALARQHSLSTPGDARIISRAFEPQRPSFPKKLPILIFATLAGLVLSLAWVVAGELLSGRAFVPAAPGYAGVPGLPRDLSGIPAGIPAGYVLQQPQIVAAAAPPPKPPKPELTPVQKRLLEKLSGMDTLGYGRRILVCPESAAADHAVAIEPLARELSATRSAILVDLSGRLQTGLAGLTELLQGLSSFGDVIERDEGSRLHVIPRGWSDLDVGPDLDVILDALSQTYDFVFIIAPEERHHTVALELAPAADLALIGAAAAISGEKAVALRMQLLEHGAGDVAVWPAPRMEDADARAPEAA